MANQSPPSHPTLRERMHRWATRVASVGREVGESAFEIAFFWRR
ncbi:hypothetical protein [Cryobacterium melibiosiphilum]|nr:hypothetical protein [Cryobacterium melibiosiphilum]